MPGSEPNLFATTIPEAAVSPHPAPAPHVRDALQPVAPAPQRKKPIAKRIVRRIIGPSLLQRKD
jgi:hypothetical protein